MFVINTLIDANDPKYNVAPGDEDQKTLGKGILRMIKTAWNISIISIFLEAKNKKIQKSTSFMFKRICAHF